MPINSSQLAYFTNLDTTQLSDMVSQSGGQPTTFISAKFMEVTNPSLPSYIFQTLLRTSRVDPLLYLVVQELSQATSIKSPNPSYIFRLIFLFSHHHKTSLTIDARPLREDKTIYQRL